MTEVTYPYSTRFMGDTRIATHAELVDEPLHQALPVVTIEKCQCGHPSCDKYGLSNGSFYQGTGFDQETAQRYADLWNAAITSDPAP